MTFVDHGPVSIDELSCGACGSLGVCDCSDRCECGARPIESCDCSHASADDDAEPDPLVLLGYRAQLRVYGTPDLLPELDSVASHIARLLVGDVLDVVPSPREFRAWSLDVCYRRMHARRYAMIAIARARGRAA